MQKSLVSKRVGCKLIVRETISLGEPVIQYMQDNNKIAEFRHGIERMHRIEVLLFTTFGRNTASSR